MKTPETFALDTTPIRYEEGRTYIYSSLFKEWCEHPLNPLTLRETYDGHVSHWCHSDVRPTHDPRAKYVPTKEDKAAHDKFVESHFAPQPAAAQPADAPSSGKAEGVEPEHVKKARATVAELDDTSAECLFAVSVVTDWEKDQRIAELEAEIEFLKDVIAGKDLIYSGAVTQIDQLTAAAAEREKEVERLKNYKRLDMTTDQLAEALMKAENVTIRDLRTLTQTQAAELARLEEYGATRLHDAGVLLNEVEALRSAHAASQARVAEMEGALKRCRDELFNAHEERMLAGNCRVKDANRFAVDQVQWLNDLLAARTPTPTDYGHMPPMQSPRFELWKLLHDEHGILALETELQDIIVKARACTAPTVAPATSPHAAPWTNCTAPATSRDAATEGEK